MPIGGTQKRCDTSKPVDLDQIGASVLKASSTSCSYLPDSTGPFRTPVVNTNGRLAALSNIQLCYVPCTCTGFADSYTIGGETFSTPEAITAKLQSLTTSSATICPGDTAYTFRAPVIADNCGDDLVTTIAFIKNGAATPTLTAKSTDAGATFVTEDGVKYLTITVDVSDCAVYKFDVSYACSSDANIKPAEFSNIVTIDQQVVPGTTRPYEDTCLETVTFPSQAGEDTECTDLQSTSSETKLCTAEICGEEFECEVYRAYTVSECVAGTPTDKTINVVYPVGSLASV